jgi:hypothetical protein
MAQKPAAPLLPRAPNNPYSNHARAKFNYALVTGAVATLDAGHPVPTFIDRHHGPHSLFGTAVNSQA